MLYPIVGTPCGFATESECGYCENTCALPGKCRAEGPRNVEGEGWMSDKITLLNAIGL